MQYFFIFKEFESFLDLFGLVWFWEGFSYWAFFWGGGKGGIVCFWFCWGFLGGWGCAYMGSCSPTEPWEQISETKTLVVFDDPLLPPRGKETGRQKMCQECLELTLKPRLSLPSHFPSSPLSYCLLRGYLQGWGGDHVTHRVTPAVPPRAALHS